MYEPIKSLAWYARQPGRSAVYGPPPECGVFMTQGTASYRGA